MSPVHEEHWYQEIAAIKSIAEQKDNKKAVNLGFK